MALVATGVEPGQRVAIWAPNSIEWIVAALAITSVGGVLVPVNTRFKGAEAAYVLARSDARVLFTVRGFLDTDYPALLAASGEALPRLRTTVLLAGERGAATTSLADFVAAGRAEPEVVSTHASTRWVPTIRATSCSPRAPRGARRAS